MDLALAIQNAIETEKSAARFYKRLALHTSNADARSALENLSAEEETHAKALEDWGRQIASEPVPWQYPTSFELIESAPGWSEAENVTVEEALHIALEAETQATLYYDAIAESINQRPLTEFFNTMAKTEETHIVAVQRMIKKYCSPP